MNTRHWALVLLVLLNACATRQTILTVPAVSVTHPSMSQDHAVQSGSKVSAEHCQADDPSASNDADVALIDEAVMKAQRESGAEYIDDFTSSQKGSCVMVEGVVMK